MPNKKAVKKTALKKNKPMKNNVLFQTIYVNSKATFKVSGLVRMNHIVLG